MPMFLFHHTLQVKSWSEFKRKFFGFVEMVFCQERVSTMDDNFVAYPEDKSKVFLYKKNFKQGKKF